MATEYRDKKPILSTVGSDQRVVGRFALGTAGVVGACRPSAGSTAANGAGNVFTVTQPNTSNGVYVVTLAEGYYLPISSQVQVNYPYNASATTVPAGQVYASAFDATTNSFAIYFVAALGTAAATASILTGATNPTLTQAAPAGTLISFEFCAKQSVSPASL